MSSEIEIFAFTLLKSRASGKSYFELSCLIAHVSLLWQRKNLALRSKVGR